MPFKSKAQRRWMYSQKPEMAKRWQEHTPKDITLPDKVGEEKKEATDVVEQLYTGWQLRRALLNTGMGLGKTAGLLSRGLKLFGPAAAMGGAVGIGILGSRRSGQSTTPPLKLSNQPAAPVKPPAPAPVAAPPPDDHSFVPLGLAPENNTA